MRLRHKCDEENSSDLENPLYGTVVTITSQDWHAIYKNKSTIINKNFLFSNLVISLIRTIRRMIHGKIINRLDFSFSDAYRAHNYSNIFHAWINVINEMNNNSTHIYDIVAQGSTSSHALLKHTKNKFKDASRTDWTCVRSVRLEVLRCRDRCKLHDVSG